MIFNKSGRKLNQNFHFTLNGKIIDIVDQYQYLGLKLRPSGSMRFATEELFDKANRAWFSISNVVYTHKRMEVNNVFRIFDSLVTPVALYGCEFWLPLILENNCFKTKSNLLDYWQKFNCEKLNQKCARIVLSVNKKKHGLVG